MRKSIAGVNTYYLCKVVFAKVTTVPDTKFHFVNANALKVGIYKIKKVGYTY